MPASGEQGFNAFILARTAATSLATGDSVAIVQGGSTRRASPSLFGAYNVVGPSGGNDTAMLNSALATSASRPVLLSFGDYDVQGPLQMPDFGVVTGPPEINLSDYYHAPQAARIRLVLSASGSWVDGDAALDVGNYCHVKDFTIFGMRNIGGHKQVDGLRISNRSYTIVENIWVNLCYVGLNCASNGAINNGSPWGNNSIGTQIRRCWLLYNETWGFLAYGINGGFFSDAEIFGLEGAANAFGGVYFASGAGNSRFVNGRFETGNIGILLEKAGVTSLVGCQFDRLSQPIVITSADTISVTGCVSASAGNTGGGSGGVGTHVKFQAQASVGNTNIQFAGNTYNQGAAATTSVYGVDAGVTVSGAFCEGGSGESNTNVYQDAYTQTVIAPLRAKLGP